MNKKGYLLHTAFACFGLLFLLLVSCKPSVPSEYLQPDEMEDMLYDYHMGMAMANQQGDVSVNQRVYKLAVLKKYDVSEHRFDSSLAYYMRHTVQLKEMYEKLTKRLENEARRQGASESDLAHFGTVTQSGDTTDIWQGNRTLLLSPYPMVNQYSYEIPADTAFKKGDRFVMNYDAQFIVQEGVRDAVCVFSVTFSNDSIATQTQHIYSEGRQTVEINNPDTLGIKEVKGYFLMLRGQQPTSTYKLLVLKNIQLIKMRLLKPDKDAYKKDSTGRQDPIRTIGGAPVRRDAVLEKAPDMGSNSPEMRTPVQAMQERGIPATR